ncbi:MAG: fused MFS/spermidine synthase, partial [Myxococcota bacterium]|nr:fused MFS/spermidine synthase [Myxococcota bacterium]
MTLSPRWIPGLAFISGVPALAYQVVWTREVALLAGSEFAGVSWVVATFFSGLAVGAAAFGRLADRVASPLRLYAWLELLSGAAAGLSTFPLRGLAPAGDGAYGAGLFVACAALLLPVTVLLGGTLPALLRAAASVPERAPRQSGRIVGANTLGAVTGVAVAVVLIPNIGLAASVQLAGSVAVGLGLLVLAASGPARAALRGVERGDHVHPGFLVAAAVVGAATLGTEVLAARLAMLRLGSSLVAWGSVLALFLAGLALGNLIVARHAERSRQPARDFGWVEIVIAAWVLLGIAGLAPAPGVSPVGLVPGALALVALTVFPPALLMGAAFPLLVRLGVRGPGVGAGFGAVSAANTLGGVAGALVVPFALVPAVGSLGAGGGLALLNAAVGWVCLGRAGTRHPVRDRVLSVVVCGFAAVLAVAVTLGRSGSGVIFVAEDAQAQVVVTSAEGDRFLWVDGEPEASTAGDARRTEMLLAVLPLLLHPAPDTFLELGLGSGITLGTASRFPLERVECVEIAEPVIRAAPLFQPDNGEALGRTTKLHNVDARVFLAGHPNHVDVIAANTLHPWSVGATGLYSVEYFERMALALEPGGIVAQWVPIAGISPDALASILATFFAVFPEGGLWWGAENLLLVGSETALSVPSPEELEARLRRAGLAWCDFGLEGPQDLGSRWLSSAGGVRGALSGQALLRDDLPALERGASGVRGAAQSVAVLRLLAGIASNSRAGAMPGVGFWLESRIARASGDTGRADRRERLAAQLGFAEADRAWARRLAAEGQREFAAGDLDAAEQRFAAAAALRPGLRSARLGAVAVAASRGDLGGASQELEAWLGSHPLDAGAWNELAGVRTRQGDLVGAREAIDRALEANPFYPEALANAGLLAV